MSEAPSAEPDRYADRAPPLAAYAAAACAHHEGRPSTLRLRSSLGEDENFPVEIFFRGEKGFFPFERFALELCRGRVLDVGSGVGAHALVLQRRGFDVVGLEVCAPLVRLQRERGVREVAWGDFRFWKGPAFDTVIMLMNGLGPTGTLEGLDRFLRHAGAWIAAGGQLLVDAGHAEPDPSALAVGWPPSGDYPGQAWIELSHGGLVGRPFRELYVDLETLASRATDAGWRFDVAFEDKTGGGLARLVLT